MPTNGTNRLRGNLMPAQLNIEEVFAFDGLGDFLQSLPKIDKKKLPADDRACPVCKTQYGDSTELQDPLKLPCGHSLGASCTPHWFSPANANRNTCPRCKATFFELEEPEDFEVDESQSDTFFALLEGPRPNFNQAFECITFLFREFNDLVDRNLLSVTEVRLQPHAPDVEGFFQVLPGQPLLVSWLLALLFEAFSRNVATVSWEEAAELGILLGQLRSFLFFQIQAMGLGLMWGGRGPNIALLRDHDSHPAIRLALENLGAAEEKFYQDKVLAVERRHFERLRGRS